MQNHIPVLLQEVIDIFKPLCASEKKPTIIDCTLGLGGHTLALLQHFHQLQIIAIDKDTNAIEIAQNRAKEVEVQDRLRIINAPFSLGLGQAFSFMDSLDTRLVGIIADIGVSSMQLDEANRGFSFSSDKLDMRMDLSQSKDAKYVINTYSEFELGRVLREYGEIKEYKKMARLIKSRIKSSGEFHSAKDFSEFLAQHFRPKSKIHPATLAFQAVRMEVNNELAELESLLCFAQNALGSRLKDSARVAIISFHSLEDRMVKEAFRHWARACVCEANAMKCVCGGNNAKGKILSKKPIIPSPQEIARNPRARSAKLRIFECK